MAKRRMYFLVSIEAPPAEAGSRTRIRRILDAALQRGLDSSPYHITDARLHDDARILRRLADKQDPEGI